MQDLNNKNLYGERIKAKSSVSQRPRFIDNICKGLLIRKLVDIKLGKLEIFDGEDTYRFGIKESHTPYVKIKVKNSHFYSSIILGGALGASESYMADAWDCSSIADLTSLFVLNRSMFDKMDHSIFTGVKYLLSALYHQTKKNSLTGSRRNISAHYDLGNDFFKLMLDPTMMYSAAIYEDANEPLEDASLRKLKTICDKLQLNENDHLLEIGTGWGAMACYAAQHYGCRVTSVTISQEQFDYAKNKVTESGLGHLIDIQLKDYRKIEGQFTKLVSIEMIEAVGHHYYGEFFRTCNSLLAPGGIFCLQAITIDDRQYDKARKTVDFIKKYIFPGCCIPSLHIIADHVKKDTDLQLYHMEDISKDYALTLRAWLNNFNNNLTEIKEMGYDAHFLRMWEYYLQYCEGAFKERAIGDVQLVYVKQDTKINLGQRYR